MVAPNVENLNYEPFGLAHDDRKPPDDMTSIPSTIGLFCARHHLHWPSRDPLREYWGHGSNWCPPRWRPEKGEVYECRVSHNHFRSQHRWGFSDELVDLIRNIATIASNLLTCGPGPPPLQIRQWLLMVSFCHTFALEHKNRCGTVPHIPVTRRAW